MEISASIHYNSYSYLGRLAKLSADFIRASEALRAWGVGEGEDLSVGAPYRTTNRL